MSDKDIQLLIALAEEELKKGFAKEEALQSLVIAGILDASENYTKPYKELEAAKAK